MATTSGLSLAASGGVTSGAGDLLETDKYTDEADDVARATPRNWLFQKLSVVVVAFSLIGAAGGWALLAAGAATFNVHRELQGESPMISDGPDFGIGGIGLSGRVVAYVVIGVFVIILTGGYFYRLKPRFHARTVFLTASTNANVLPITA